jgi:streptomycin 6-kinase
LHSDLYAENVLWDEVGEPVFIDPHAKVGSPAFDWAFWCVYYVPTSGFAERVALCRQYAPAELDKALAWSLTLAVDGALYYLDTDDHQAAAMLAVLASEPLKPLVHAPS